MSFVLMFVCLCIRIVYTFCYRSLSLSLSQFRVIVVTRYACQFALQLWLSVTELNQK